MITQALESLLIQKVEERRITDRSATGSLNQSPIDSAQMTE